jgi:hypothetical protein
MWNGTAKAMLAIVDGVKLEIGDRAPRQDRGARAALIDGEAQRSRFGTARFLR